MNSTKQILATRNHESNRSRAAFVLTIVLLLLWAVVDGSVRGARNQVSAKTAHELALIVTLSAANAVRELKHSRAGIASGVMPASPASAGAFGAGGDQQIIDRAAQEIIEGDADITRDEFEEALADYALAWGNALLAQRGL